MKRKKQAWRTTQWEHAKGFGGKGTEWYFGWLWAGHGGGFCGRHKTLAAAKHAVERAGRKRT